MIGDPAAAEHRPRGQMPLGNERPVLMAAAAAWTAAAAEGAGAGPAAAAPYAQDLNAAQRRAALHDVDAPLLVLAGDPGCAPSPTVTDTAGGAGG